MQIKIYFQWRIGIMSNLMFPQKIGNSVTPANAGVRNHLKRLDSGFRRNDDKNIWQWAKSVDEAQKLSPLP